MEISGISDDFQMGEATLNFDSFDSNFLRNVMNVTLHQEQKNLIYLRNFAAELQQEFNGNITLTESLIDRILVSCLTEDCKGIFFPLEYIILCYQNSKKLLASSRSGSNLTEQKRTILEFSVSLFRSYTILILEFPSMFINCNQEIVCSQFVSLLTNLDSKNLKQNRNPNTNVQISNDLISEITEELNEERLLKMFGGIFCEISYQLREMSLLDPYLSIFDSFSQLLKIKKLISVLILTPEFKTEENGKKVEFESILGTFFGFTTFSDAENNNNPALFSNEVSSSKRDTELNIVTFRGSLDSTHKLLHDLIRNMLRDASHRIPIISWFALVLNSNAERLKMQVNPDLVSSDGFLLNITSVLLQLCRPFMAPNDRKIDKIDPYYYTNHNYSRLKKSLITETRLNVTEEELEDWIKNNPKDLEKEPPSFITECFFLTLYSFHIGFLKSVKKYGKIVKKLQEQTRTKQDILSENNDGLDPYSNPQTKFILSVIDQNIEKLTEQKFGAQTQLFNPIFLQDSIQFFSLTMDWILNLIKLPENSLNLENIEPNILFISLPESCLESTVEFFLFLANSFPLMIEGNYMDILIKFLTVFIGNTHFVKNPYLRAKLVEVIVALIPIDPQENFRSLIFQTNTQITEVLAPFLMRFYSDIEHTGGSNQFYDKFNVRYFIGKALSYLWTLPPHHDSMCTETKIKTNFLKFVNMLLNDSIYLLDESLSKLSEIHDYEIEQKSENWLNLTRPQREEILENLDRNQRQVKSYLLLADENVGMLRYLSADVKAPFIVPELIERLASMLNYFLAQLAGPKCSNLKVSNPEKYHFDPKHLLSVIVDILMNFSNFLEFKQAVIADGRSYSPDLFENVEKILRRTNIKTAGGIEQFNTVANSIKELHEKNVQAEEDLGEIPDEFLDPITFSLMKDPVKLPSGTTLEKATILRALLSDPIDPFTRAPLTEADLVPDVELKEKIEKFMRGEK